MKNISPLALLWAILVLAACQGSPQAEEKAAPVPVALETLTVAKKAGADCEKPDTSRFHCAEITLRYPAVKTGNDTLKTAVDNWAKAFLSSMVSASTDPDNLPPLEEAMQQFIDNHAAMVAEMPDMRAYYVADAQDSTLRNDGRFLTLRIDCYTYLGGAHPNASTAIATWETATGRQLQLEDIFTDLDALKARAEKKFREVKAEVFIPQEEGGYGFNFDESNPFKLADNTGLTDKGVFFCYVPYEVAAYAFGPTEFELTFEEVADLLKEGFKP
jgi:hypothetical protein